MFTTNPFSIRTNRGMGEFDPPGTYRERGVEGGARSAREGATHKLWKNGAYRRFSGKQKLPERYDEKSACLRGSSERIKRARRPHPTSLSAVVLALHRRERATKNSKR